MIPLLLMTKKGYESLQRSLTETKKKTARKRKELGEAQVGDPDIHVNVVFRDLRNELNYTLPAERNRILQEIANAVIIEDSKEYKEATFDTVIPGAKIKVMLDRDMEEFLIAGPPDADPDEGVISYKSPLGKALIGLKVGNESTFITLDSKEIKLKIKAIERGLP